MTESTLLHDTNPDELTEKLLKGFEERINRLKEEFQPKEPTEFLTRNEVKDLLKINLSTLYLWSKKGKLKAYACGNRIYYKRSEVEQAIKPLF